MKILDLLARRRAVYCGLLLLLPCIGLSVRANRERLPHFLADYAPDVLWALLVFVLVASCAPRLLTRKAAAISLTFAVLVECSQLYQAPWINAVRATRLGGLLLGYGFLWSDLVCYSIGIGLGVALDSLLRGQRFAYASSHEHAER